MRKSFRNIIGFPVLLLVQNLMIINAADWTDAAHNPFPTKIPDHVILTWSDNPVNTQSVTWRTDTSIKQSWAEIAEAEASPNFTYYSKGINAVTESFVVENYSANYHSATFDGLKANTLYAYRVGSEENWSEWFQFRTASEKPQPFTFIYLGDGQNALLSLWSRAIRAAYGTAPDSRFIIHGGDLVSNADSYTQWSKWFKAAGWINAMVPSIPVVGNHEYYHKLSEKRQITPYWFPQFTLPENGITKLPESNYFIDFQGVRVIVLNSNELIGDQAKWIEKISENNSNRWTVVSFHHPIYSGARGRDQEEIRRSWQPLFRKYAVDLVLNGHDHTYARGGNIDAEDGIVYVVSVSGPKQYDLTDDRWMTRSAENTQSYHVIRVEDDVLNFKSYTVTGDLYDEFDIQKNPSGPNIIIDKQNEDLPERTFKNTPGKPQK